MLDKIAEDIIGEYIEDIEKLYDYYQIRTKKTIINIYNKCICYQKNRGELIDVQSIEFKNKEITHISFKENCYICLTIDFDIIIEVLLGHEYYIGPEAMSVNFNNGNTLVVN